MIKVKIILCSLHNKSQYIWINVLLSYIIASSYSNWFSSNASNFGIFSSLFLGVSLSVILLFFFFSDNSKGMLAEKGMLFLKDSLIKYGFNAS